MDCIWCSNPESQKRSPELLYREHLCSHCYRCIEACHNKAIRVLDSGSLEIDRGLCQGCGKCEVVCLSDARRISGKQMTVDEVMEVVMKDTDYYRKSGGGVTASGGEPTSQPEFLSDLFERCQGRGLHTTLDTCAYVDWDTFEQILEHVDLVLFDIKLIDAKLHKQLTGVGNEVVLNNARLTVKKGIPLIIRVPLVPDCTDSPENAQAIAQFALELGGVEVNLLPYHKFSLGKYEALDRKCELAEVDTLKPEQIDGLAEQMRSYGVPVKVIY